ncbi:MAG: metallophosphoesterase [Candidatus Heimdallarchaeota archaeon]|nr:metallophosphoesterase [Candidatus Heimdallarchaeota archaeon]
MKSKSLIAVILCVFFISSAISFNGYSSDVIAETQNQSPLIELEESYNATSSEEFFNETSFPRYHLAARPFGMIQYPNKANPKIALFGEQINIIVNTSEDANEWIFTLVNGSTEISLDIINLEYVNETWLFKTLPSSQIEGLYDLQLNCSMGDDYQTHAVKLVESKQYPFSFVHISDLHFPAYNTPENINSTDINLGEFKKIEALDPDFIICTGDIMQGPTNMFLDPATGKPLKGEIQLKLALWALDTLDLPIYYIHGNHEVSPTNMVPDNLEENWYKYLGPVRYQNFTYLDWHLIGFGSSFEGLTSDEILKVRQLFIDNGDLANIFYYHSDFNNNPSSMISRFPVELALHGHEHENGLYRSGHTVYHKQAPLFHQSFSVITITNSTSVTLHDQIYNFDLTYTPSTNTEETNAYTFLIVAPVLLVIAIIIRKKRTFS